MPGKGSHRPGGIRHEADPVDVAQEQGTVLADVADGTPARAAVDGVLPGAVAAGESGDGDSLERPRVGIGHRRPDDRGDALVWDGHANSELK